MDDSVRSSRTADADRVDRVVLETEVFVVSSYRCETVPCALEGRTGRAVMVVRDLDPTVEAAPIVLCGVDVRGGEVLLTC